MATLAEELVAILRADSAGVSVLHRSDADQHFSWVAVAGAWRSHVGTTTPRHFGPSGEAVDRGEPTLLEHAERRYPYLESIVPRAVEWLIAPFFIDGAAAGTVWMVAHSGARRFDEEDVRQVEDVAATFAPVFEARRQRFSLALPPDPVWVDADLTRLEQVLANLLNNSASYTADDGTISLQLESLSAAAAIHVVDNGQGISADALPHVFDLFAQHTEQRPNGLGIGLRVVRGLVELHGGSVAAHSDGPGRGSEFIVTLPRVHAVQGRGGAL